MRKLTFLRPRAIRTACLLLALSLLPGVGSAQTPPLGEVARKEQERRRDAPPAIGKVYTNKDLPPAKPEAAGPRPDASGVLPSAAKGNQSGAVTPTPDDDKADNRGKDDTLASGSNPAVGNDEAEWRQRVTAAREELRRSQMFAEALQTRSRSLARDSMSRDDPAARAHLRQDRAEVTDELARVTQDIERAKKQIADLEEEARKAGVPAGWLR